MADNLRRWTFHDYGAKQFVRDEVSGEFLYVHGAGALFADGPFRFDLQDSMPLLTGLSGGDYVCALHIADSASKHVVSREVHPTFGNIELKLRRGHSDPSGEWLADLERQYDAKCLNVEVGDGFPPFRAEFTWFRAPTMCGDKPVQVWLDLRWLVEYTLGMKKQVYIHRYADKIKKELESVGLRQVIARTPSLPASESDVRTAELVTRMMSTRAAILGFLA